jgi:histidine triad (HIT) family protein
MTFQRGLANLSAVVKKVAIMVKQAFSADGLSIVENNGRAAEQHIFHIHFHVTPRFIGKRLPSYDEAHTCMCLIELDAVAK